MHLSCSLKDDKLYLTDKEEDSRTILIKVSFVDLKAYSLISYRRGSQSFQYLNFCHLFAGHF